MKPDTNKKVSQKNHQPYFRNPYRTKTSRILTNIAMLFIGILLFFVAAYFSAHSNENIWYYHSLKNTMYISAFILTLLGVCLTFGQVIGEFERATKNTTS